MDGFKWLSESTIVEDFCKITLMAMKKDIGVRG